MKKIGTCLLNDVSIRAKGSGRRWRVQRMQSDISWDYWLKPVFNRLKIAKK
ncbi:MAG: hypothetical protein WCJ26_00375 [bacterium]